MRSLTLLLVMLIGRRLCAQETSATGLILSDSVTISKAPFAALMGSAVSLVDKDIEIDGFPPVDAQGDIGSCTSWSTGYYLMGHYYQLANHFTSFLKGKDRDGDKTFNPLYMHNKIKECSTSCLRCGSANLRALSFLCDTGITTFNEYPLSSFARNACSDKTGPALVPLARQHTFRNYSAIVNQYIPYAPGLKTAIIKDALRQEYPVILSLVIDEPFRKAYRIPNYTWDHFEGNDTSEMHSLICVGYSSSKQAFKIINSWSSSWGDQGMGWITSAMIDRYLKEAFIVNVPADYVIPTSAFFRKNYEVQQLQTGPGFTEIAGHRQGFFIENRYLDFRNIRMIPLKIRKTKKLATIKFYSINQAGTMAFIGASTFAKNGDLALQANGERYLFTVNSIRPWRLLGRPAVFFTVKRL